MPNTYAGNGTIPTATLGVRDRIAIISTSNTTPVIVTVAPGWGGLLNDTIEIEGAAQAALNGLWTITPLTSSTFSLNGSTLPGATGGMAGYVIDYQVQPAFPLPSPGDLASASKLDATLQGLANAIPWAYRNAGAYKLYELYSQQLFNSGNGLPPWSQWSSLAAVNYSATNGTPLPYSGVSLDQILNGGTGPAPVVAPTDLLDISYTFTIGALATGTANSLGVSIAFYQPLAAPVAIASTSNASPVVVSSIAHGMGDQNYVGISNAAIAALNGTWRITKIDNNTYSLNGSTAPGSVGGAAGTGTRLAQGQLLGSTQVITAPLTPGNLYTMNIRGIASGFATPEDTVWFALNAQPALNVSTIATDLFGPAQIIINQYRPI